MIFAAGFGTRMGEMTKTLPKPMIPLAGRPMVDLAIDHLIDAGITNIVANCHHLAERIAPHLQSRGVRTIIERPDILDTGGGLRNALPLMDSELVITMNPDALWLGANPITALLRAWRNDMQALLLVVPAHKALGTQSMGDFSLEHGEISRNGPFIYSGAQIIRTDRLGEIEGQAFSLNAYWNLLAESNGLNGAVYDGDWCDIGTPEGLAAGQGALSDV